MLSQNENLDLKWAAAPSVGPGDPAHRRQSRQTPRLEPTAPASLPPAALLQHLYSTIKMSHSSKEARLLAAHKSTAQNPPVGANYGGQGASCGGRLSLLR